MGSSVYAAFWQEWKLVAEMLGCRGGVKGGRREEVFLGWNAGRMGLEGSYFLQGGHGISKEFLSSFPKRRRKPWGLVHLG